MTMNACINEIFSSLQGEGSHVGEKMTFVRFAKCTLGCQWCDTDHNSNKNLKVYEPHSSDPTRIVSNPIGIVELNNVLELFTDPVVALTGGEPLEQVDFLLNLLPYLHRKRKILLETNGIHYKALEKISDYVDIISMDIKLPSSTGRMPLWDEHRQFIKASIQSGKELYVKLVVTSETTDKDLNNAIKLISTTNRHIQVILQPVSPTSTFPDSISDDKLLSFKRLFGAWLPNVSIVPQMHKVWE